MGAKTKTRNKMAVMAKIRTDSRYFFMYFKKIAHELKQQHWKPKNIIFIPYEVSFTTAAIGYDHNAMILLEKAFKRMGWKISLKKFSFSKGAGGNFTFLIERLLVK